jgi:hypothetical protein
MGPKVFDMYKNSELYNKSKSLKTGKPVGYRPQTDLATIDTEAKEKTIEVKDWEKLQNNMKKYFGTTDAYSIYVPAAEQEFGAGKKKPSTEANKNIVNG